MENVKLELDSKAVLGEGAIWDYERKLLYWIDIIKCEVHIFNPQTLENITINTGEMIGTVVPRKSGGLLLAMESGFYFLDDKTKELKFITDPEVHMCDNRFNDGKCDPAGRFWAGTMSKKDELNKGNLYCLQNDLSVNKMLEGISISNGIVWSPNKKTMYYIDTLTMEVWGFDYNIDTGDISNKRVIIVFDEKEGLPDGMTIDSEGMVWIAHWNGWKVSRWNPINGVKLQEINVPVAEVTSCAFGGDNLDILYITTASIGLSDEDIIKQPHAGGLFSVKTDVRGLPSYKFEG